MPMTMGGRIRELRQRRDMTQEELVEILYMKKSMLLLLLSYAMIKVSMWGADYEQ